MSDVLRSLRQVVAVAFLLALLPTCGNGPGGSDSAGDDDGSVQPPPGPLGIALTEIASAGLTSPVFVTHAGDGSGRLFVVQQTGQVRIIDASGTLLPTPFLDVSALMVTLDTIFDERGLLGLAFHPDYANNGRFFVRYSAPRTGVNGEPCFGTSRGCHESILSEFSVSAGDPNVADATSERIVFRIDQPQFNHDGGHLAFGADGNLYFGLGDGGGAHDGLGNNPPDHGPIGNGQDTTTLLGALLRIDVDAAPPVGAEYAIPASNPFVGLPGADEIYAFGLRNPYRFSFDDGPGGDDALYVADVGQNLLEEVNVVNAGDNLGWVIREGTNCFDPQDPNTPLPACAAVGAGGEPLVDPVLVYPRSVGISIIGGHVYRGSGVPDLAGRYVFGDWSSSFGPADGHLFVTDITGVHAFVRRDLQIQPGNQDLGLVLLGIGEDEAGELYVCGSTVSAPGGPGVVLRIDPAP